MQSYSIFSGSNNDEITINKKTIGVYPDLGNVSMNNLIICSFSWIHQLFHISIQDFIN